MSHENEYTELIAGGHPRQPKYVDWVYTLTEPLRVAKQRLIDLQQAFNLDYAVGDQLDALGARIGIGRELPMRLTGIYFALDDEDGIGLDLGLWKGRFDPTDGVTRLDDELYRSVLKSKILINHWDGKNGSLPDLITQIMAYFKTDAKILDLQDFQTMELAVNLTKATTPPVVWTLISHRFLDIISAGVGVNITNNDPWFGFDYNTSSVKGMDDGYWFPLFVIEKDQD